MAASRLRFKMRRFVIMGVAGSGKSTVGAELAKRLGGVYVDGDDLHPPENIAKMARGEPLNDADREPWLDKVGAVLRDAQGIALIGCSALKLAYRDRIRVAAGGSVTFIHLVGTRKVIEMRMADRSGHFMPLSLLDSQFADLESPKQNEKAISVDIDQPLDSLVEALVAQISKDGP